MSWDVPWYSSEGSDFNYDFGVTIDASRGFDVYNFRTLDEFAAMGQESMKTSDQPYDMPGLSCFIRVDGKIFPHLLPVRPGPRVERRLVLLPRPHRPRPPGGVGGAQGPEPIGPPIHARLLDLSIGGQRAVRDEHYASGFGPNRAKGPNSICSARPIRIPVM